jgi:hypothetical protein
LARNFAEQNLTLLRCVLALGSLCGDASNIGARELPIGAADSQGPVTQSERAHGASHE